VHPGRPDQVEQVAGILANFGVRPLHVRVAREALDRAPKLAAERQPRGVDRARIEPSGDDGRPQPWALYDTGQAAAALVTQAQADGLAVHQMGGFDTDAVRAGFGLPDALTPVVVLAIGLPGDAIGLPEPLAAREGAPRTRHPLSDLLLTAPAGHPVAA